jgi:Uma2 family endonuclease
MAMPVTLRRFTVDELASFPDDGNRYELLDGVLFVTPAPQPAHEELVSRLWRLLTTHVQPWPEVRIAARSEVVLPPSNKLEPDLQVYRAASLPRRWSDVRDRWLAVEVASESTRTYDREYKRDGYIDLGVQEVWLVNRFEKLVRMTTRTMQAETEHRSELVWTPPPPVPQLRIELAELFLDLPDEW